MYLGPANAIAGAYALSWYNLLEPMSKIGVPTVAHGPRLISNLPNGQDWKVVCPLPDPSSVGIFLPCQLDRFLSAAAYMEVFLTIWRSHGQPNSLSVYRDRRPPTMSCGATGIHLSWD